MSIHIRCHKGNDHLAEKLEERMVRVDEGGDNTSAMNKYGSSRDLWGLEGRFDTAAEVKPIKPVTSVG